MVLVRKSSLRGTLWASSLGLGVQGLAGRVQEHRKTPWSAKRGTVPRKESQLSGVNKWPWWYDFVSQEQILDGRAGHSQGYSPFWRQHAEEFRVLHQRRPFPKASLPEMPAGLPMVHLPFRASAIVSVYVYWNTCLIIVSSPAGL